MCVQVRMESQIVAQAGLPGCVTIATNMAGRGTDIILGGSPEGLTQLVLLRLVYRPLMAGELKPATRVFSLRPSARCSRGKQAPAQHALAVCCLLCAALTASCCKPRYFYSRNERSTAGTALLD